MTGTSTSTPTTVASAALANETRLALFRALVAAGPDGLSAGALATHAGISPSNLTAHMTILTHAGMAEGRRAGRNRLYAANLPATARLVGFLIADCCGGHPGLCHSVSKQLAACAKDACN
ncbi:MAG: ArsR/SmtB family transcription factor [Caulobacterales bacterium]